MAPRQLPCYSTSFGGLKECLDIFQQVAFIQALNTCHLQNHLLYASQFRFKNLVTVSLGKLSSSGNFSIRIEDPACNSETEYCYQAKSTFFMIEGTSCYTHLVNTHNANNFCFLLNDLVQISKRATYCFYPPLEFWLLLRFARQWVIGTESNESSQVR